LREKERRLMPSGPGQLRERLGQAVARFWRTRRSQAGRQKLSGRADQGARSAVTGGAQMDGFIALCTELIVAAGLDGTERRGILVSGNSAGGAP
jgi:hypothetical protein